MKTLKDIDSILTTFAEKFGVDAAAAQQQSAEWYRLRLGVVTASCASKVVAKLDSETRLSYMCQLVGEVLTGQPQDEINSKYIDWGNQNEDAARSSYEFEANETLVKVPFVFKDDSFRVGCSPDALIQDKRGVEIKCPYNTQNYVKFLVEEKLKPEYVWQNQFQMWVLDCDSWDACQFDPRVNTHPFHRVTVKRDAEKIKTLEDLVPQFISDMDEMLKKAGSSFTKQWSR